MTVVLLELHGTAAGTRIDELVERMTIREKIGQLCQDTLYRREDVERVLPLVRKGELGSFIFNETLKREWRDELQRAALESRLKIPLSFADNIIHGWYTNFPIPLGLACAFEPELFEKTSAIGAREGRQSGLDWTFGPMCDTARDPRWGRVSEGTGEDPWLNGVYAAAAVRGFQGTDASAPDRVAVCLKHFCGYGSSVGGRDYNDADFNEWSFRNVHLPPFRAAVKAGALTVMSGFNTCDGVPVLASRRVMTDILRGEWGFRGMVVSDFRAVAQTITWGYAADEEDAAVKCLTAGNDVEMIPMTYDRLETAVASGRLDMSVIDRAVRRVLEMKQAVGLFERPWAVNPPNAATLARQHAEAFELARECATKSAVLLKNDGALPLTGKGLKIALIGPLAEDRRTMIGCWAGMANGREKVRTEPFGEAMRREFGADAELTVCCGCATTAKPPVFRGDDGIAVLDRSAKPADDSFDVEGAIAAARAADVVVFALGESHDWTGENASRSQLTLTGRQQELFDGVTAAVPGKKVVSIVCCGRPLSLTAVRDRSNALIYAFHGGVGCPAALSAILHGTSSPSGRLTISVPYDVSQVPVFYNATMTGRPHQGRYLDTPEWGAMYPFGYGLTYAKFAYSPVTVEDDVARAEIRNVGSQEGTETVQLYIRQLACSEGVRPKRELRGFRKVTLAPGESAEVSFGLDEEALGYVDRSGRDRCDRGRYQVWIAPDSASGDPAMEVYGK